MMQKTQRSSKTKQEIVTKTLAIHFACAALGGFSMFLQDRSRIQLLYSMVGENYRNDVTFIVIFIMEAYVYMYANANTVLVLFIHLSFFAKWTEELKELGIRLRDPKISSSVNIEECFQTCRQYFFLTHLFNIGNRHIIFGLKIVHLFLSIVMGYSGILFIHQNVVLGVHNIALGFMFALLYMVIYDKAFRIRPEIANLKKEMSVAVTMACSRDRSRLRGMHLLLNKNIQAVPDLGIQLQVTCNTRNLHVQPMIAGIMALKKSCSGVIPAFFLMSSLVLFASAGPPAPKPAPAKPTALSPLETVGTRLSVFTGAMLKGKCSKGGLKPAVFALVKANEQCKPFKNNLQEAISCITAAIGLIQEKPYANKATMSAKLEKESVFNPEFIKDFSNQYFGKDCHKKFPEKNGEGSLCAVEAGIQACKTT
ncbi:unnamed protein product [Allacma fusca]|uniref:Uncharacterized protein n=1 Tax=Allacma fusca TaxID=39272 RepID=A0A8J2P9S9_9HEXA|nr:unnamed protein product [Allacma fusca]